MAKTALIRNLDPELWQRVRIQALTEGVSAQELVKKALAWYLLQCTGL